MDQKYERCFTFTTIFYSIDPAWPDEKNQKNCVNAEPTSNNLHARTQPPCIHQTQPYDSYALLHTNTHPAYELQRPARNYSQSTTSLAQSELYIITPDVISCTAPPLCCCDFLTSREKAISLTTMTWGTHHPHRIASHCIASPRIDLVVMRRCVLRIPASVNSVSQDVPGCWYRAHKPQGVMSTSSSDLECRITYSGTRVPTTVYTSDRHVFSWGPTADLQPAPDRSKDCLSVSTLPEQTPG